MVKLNYLRPLAVAVSLTLSGGMPTFAAQHGTQKSEQSGQSSGQAKKIIKDWKEKPRKVADEIIEKYGMPQEMTPQRLIWHNNGPWKRTELINEEIDHDFPMPRKDMLNQVISYEVPGDKFDKPVAYGRSLIAERTRGEMSARCDEEAANGSRKFHRPQSCS